MKIVSVKVTTVILPRNIPASMLKVFGPGWATTPVVIAQVRTDTGLEGVGYTLTLNPEFTRSLATMVEELGELLIGHDPHRTEDLFRRMLYPSNWVGPGGLLNIAAAALDIAIWDLKGKDLDQPLWRLLGGASDRARVYDSNALLSMDIDELQQAAADSVKRGYTAMKLRPGLDRHGPIRDVVARVRAVREAIGFDIDLMYDVNQTWTPARCIQVGRALEDQELYWIEDPTLMHDIAGQADVAASLATPICSGEYHYDAPPLLRLLNERAVDYLMVDLLRQGGITQFRKVAAMAEVFGVQVSSHIIPEVYAHCIAAIPNGLIVEGMPWTEMLFTGVPELVAGDLVLSERPGHGLELDMAAIERYAVG